MSKQTEILNKLLEINEIIEEILTIFYQLETKQVVVEPWITLSEYLEKTNFPPLGQKKRIALGMEIRKKMLEQGIEPLRTKKSNRYPESVIREVVR